MALFFDLSIPYLELATSPNNKALKETRLRSVVRAMELGYTAVAYDRPHRGIISDADRCKIPPFPLSSLLKAAPAIASSASFHRGLLGTPTSALFRQYSRITVHVDSLAGAAAVSSGNSVLRTYDLVAVRPMKQEAFDHACKVSEVDIIALDFSQKLPFRLKLPMVEAATKRGVHFEITYAHLIIDSNVRNKMLSDAKQLVAWTRGKNLIFSSAAPTVNEIRGPYDVANLSSFLLGLSMERAKAAMCKNCRSLMANTLRKKHYYKEAIRIERILPNEMLNPDWDPISSGEGDLPPLDDIAKFFYEDSKVPKSSIATRFMSAIDGTQLKDQIGHLLSAPHEIPSSTKDSIEQVTHTELPVEEMISTTVASIEQQTPGSEGDLVSSSNMTPAPTDSKNPGSPISHEEDPKSANAYSMVFEEDVLITPVVETIEPMCMEDHKSMDGADGVSAIVATSNNTSRLGFCIPSVASDKNLLNENGDSFIILEEMDVAEEKIMTRQDERENKIQISSFDGTPFQIDFVKTRPNEGENTLSLCGEMPLDDRPDEVTEDQHEFVHTLSLCGEMPLDDRPDEVTEDQHEFVLVGTSAPLDKGLFKIEEGKQNDCAAAKGIKAHEIESGKGKRKKRSLIPAYPMPFKGLLKPMLFKRKTWRLRRLSKHL